MVTTHRRNSDVSAFKKLLSQARNIFVLTGAGISAESGVPTFRGDGGFWRNYNATDLASLSAFHADPGLVWEFYHYRRELVHKRAPNVGHFALAAAESKYNSSGRSFTIITQNVDGLHARAGSKHILELHGNLYKTRCTKCGYIRDNFDSPICPALQDRGSPKFDPQLHTRIPESSLPRCKCPKQAVCSSGLSDSDRLCNGLLRPHIVWFGECLDPEIVRQVELHLSSADVGLVIGTSAVVYPAAGFASSLAARGVPVAEVNIEATPITDVLSFFFQGKSGDILPLIFEDLALT